MDVANEIVANEIKSSLDKYTHILNHKSKRRRVSYDSSTILYEEEEENSEYRFCEDMKIKKENEKKRIERVKADEEKIENQKLDIDSKVKIAKSSRRVIIELKYRKKDDTCALCMEDMENKKVQHTPCGHSFHMSCLDKQFTEYKDYRCSLCRYQIYQPEYVPDPEYSYTFRNAFRLTDNSYLEALAEIADAEWNANNAYVHEEPLANEGHDEESKQHSLSQDEIKLVTSEEDDNSLSDEIITTIAFIVYQHRRINIQLQQVIEETMRVERQTEELARAIALGGVPREESVRLRGRRRRVRMRELRRAIIDVLRNI